jgi:hypothetical protein
LPQMIHACLTFRATTRGFGEALLPAKPLVPGIAKPSQWHDLRMKKLIDFRSPP